MAQEKDTKASTTTITTTTNTTSTTTTTHQSKPSNSQQKHATSTEQAASNTTRNFKNLRISTSQSAGKTDDSMKCQCPHYFNTECVTDPLLVSENIPSTVKSVSPDSCTYGTHYPNRIFVGHLSGKANATDLADFFRSYGTVLEGKVVLDSFGRSRRFGFVTFATHDDVQNVLSKIPIFFKGKKINVGPAVKKMFGAEFSPPMSPTTGCGEMGSVSDEGEQEDVSETIITVPPVNEPKDVASPSTPKSGNVWLKINMKPKAAPKKVPEKSKPSPSFPTSPFFYQSPRQQGPHVSPFHAGNIPLFFSPPVFTPPFNQTYAYQSGFIPHQPPVTYIENGQTYYLNPVGPVSPQSPIYYPGPLTVA